jgi:hypothetical protein
MILIVLSLEYMVLFKLEIYYIYKHGGQAMLLNLISNITKVVY